MFARHRPLFKAHDIRGASTLFDDFLMARLAQVFARQYTDKGASKVALGFDVRPKSEQLAQYFYHAFITHGIEVIWLGLVSTPMLAYFAHHEADGNGVMMTASHSPKGTAGIKWLMNGNSSHQAEILAIFEQLHTATPLTCPAFATPPCQIQTTAYGDTLVQTIRALTEQPMPFLGKTGVIDCLNGATSQVAKQIFVSLGGTWIMLNNLPDGNFPKGNPDPTEPNRLAELQTAVLQHKANLGLAFDGDGDRLAVIDDKGRLVAFDWLIWLLAQASKTQHKPHILFDVKCTHRLTHLLMADEFSPIMVPTGSSHLRRLLQHDHPTASFAGELSGHFIFNDGKFICHDDGIYAGLRLLAYLGNKKLSSILDNLPPIFATPDLYLDAPNDNPKTFIQNLTTLIQHSSLKNHLIDIDGVRLEFDTGFILMRASNTANQLTLRATFDSRHDFQRISQNFCELLKTLDSNFANGISQTLHHYGELSV